MMVFPFPILIRCISKEHGGIPLPILIRCISKEHGGSIGRGMSSYYLLIHLMSIGR
jgi:hypothetical protein